MSNPKFDRRVNTIAITRRSRGYRQRIIPILTWALAIVAFLTLNSRQTGIRFAIGLVEINEVSVSPLGDGILRSLRVDLFDTIKQGDIVAMMDDTLVVAELAIEEAQLGQIRAELDVERKRLENDIEQSAVDQLDNLRRYQLNEEQARLEYLEISVDVEADQIKLERLKIQMERHELLVSEDIGDISTYDDVRLRYEELEQELKANQVTLQLAKQNAEESTQRRIERQAQSSEPTRNTLLYLEPHLQELKVQEARRQEIQQQRLTLVLHAPISGQIAKLYYSPGETVLSGTPMLTIQSTTSTRVMAYIDEQSAARIKTGAPVQLRSVGRPDRVATAKVLRAGTSLQEIPSRIWSTPIFAEYGFPILIGEVPENAFLPGETVTVRFEVSGN